MAGLYLDDSACGPFLPYLQDEMITDLNYNGESLWIDHLIRGRYMEPSFHIESSFINRFSTQIANLMNRSFNQYEPLLEAETDSLRISIIHESAANTGRSISIRKTPAVKRLDRERILSSSYCTAELDVFMENAVRAGLNIVACGLPGAGKTEYLKYLSGFILPEKKAVTVEDNLEIRYRQINPGKDCLEIKVGENFDYAKAIKASMRQLPSWLILSEARSIEARYLLESMSTGISCMTTIHADDVKKIPDRFVNMTGQNVTDEVYSFLDIAVLIGCYHVKGEGILRRIEQAALFERDEEGNHVQVFYEDAKMHRPVLSKSLLRKFRFAGIEDPFLRREEL